ncbi:unnamed protein product [Discula destructiva]
MLQSLTYTLLLLGRAATATATTLPLFQPWSQSDWKASDDVVRPGGLSRSYLEVIAPETPDNPFCEPIIRFYGTLNTEVFNGTGFASQRTADDWPGLDLSAYSGLIIEVPYTDGRKYTFNVKDTVLPPVNGGDRASVSWEHNFQLPASLDVIAPPGDLMKSIVKFEDLVPTFQGRVQNDIAPLNLASIKRMNIMIRGFFGLEGQAGDFELMIKSVTAFT